MTHALVGLAGKQVERSYTPVLPLNDHRHTTDGSSLELMIKLYKNGRMSQYLSHLKIGKLSHDAIHSNESIHNLTTEQYLAYSMARPIPVY